MLYVVEFGDFQQKQSMICGNFIYNCFGWTFGGKILGDKF